MSCSAAKSSTSRPPYGKVYPVLDQAETVAGDLWTVKKEGEDWPIVICDEDIVLTFFKGRNRPSNARHADGTWAEDYKPGAKRMDQRCYPAVLLGALKFTWVSWKVLEQFDKEMGEVIEVSTTNSLLAQAWREALRLFEAEDPLPDLKQRIRPQDSNLSASDVQTPSIIAKRKRKGTPNFKYPPGYAREEVDDEESEGVFFRMGSSTGPRIKREYSNSESPADTDICSPDVDFVSSGFRHFTKKSKLDTSGRFSTRPCTPSRGAPTGISGSRAASNSGLKTEFSDPSKVIIYVGNPHTKFKVSRRGMDASPCLLRLIAHHPENGWYIMSPMLSRMNEEDFLPVAQYLERGEYDPNILDDGTEWVRLEGEVSGNEAAEEIIRCATIYNIAQTVELPGLQSLAFRKLKALAKHEPHQPFAILCVVEHVFGSANTDMRQYLVQYLADHFWQLVLAENKKLAEVMQDNEALATGVFGLLGTPSELEAKFETTEEVDCKDLFPEVKEEPQPSCTVKEDKAQKNLSERGGTAEKGTAGEYHAEQTDPQENPGHVQGGVAQAEREMIKMALRQSDPEATEENLTRMMEGQSKIMEAYEDDTSLQSL